ncbi:hypothetical protein PFISCL1PPCAC_3472, partial [Pristionchus fissidentatus]
NPIHEGGFWFNQRLDLALRLKLRSAVRRLLSDGEIAHCKSAVATLIEHNSFDTFKDCFTTADLFRSELTNEIKMKRDDSDDLVPISVDSSFGDAVNVTVDGVHFLVSSSTLSLHSETLRTALKASSANETDPLKLDISVNSFQAFLQACIGIFPEKVSCQLLDDLVKLGATNLHKYYFEKSRREIKGLSSELRSKRVTELLQHSHNQLKLDRRALNSITARLTNEELRTILAHCSFISKEMRYAVLTEMQQASNFSIFVKPMHLFEGREKALKGPSGNPYELFLERGSQTCVEELKELIHQRGDVHPDSL